MDRKDAASHRLMDQCSEAEFRRAFTSVCRDAFGFLGSRLFCSRTTDLGPLTSRPGESNQAAT